MRYALTNENVGRALIAGAELLKLIPKIPDGAGATIEQVENGVVVSLRTVRETAPVGAEEAPQANAEATDQAPADMTTENVQLRRRVAGLETELGRAHDLARQHWSAYVGADAQMRAAQERERVAHDHRSRAEQERIAAEVRLVELGESVEKFAVAFKASTVGRLLLRAHIPTTPLPGRGTVFCRACGLVQENWKGNPECVGAKKPEGTTGPASGA